MKVSILIPCFNAERWIGQAIQSALDQTYTDKEIIVVDDGSTDGSLPIIQSFGDKITWESGTNRGGNVARNRLLELSSGEWVQYLDADDYLLADKVQRQVEFLEQRRGGDLVDVVCSPVAWESWGKDGVKKTIMPIPAPRDPWLLLALWLMPQTGGALWRREALHGVGGWKPDQPCCQENELYLRLLKSGRSFLFCEQAGAVYRLWSHQTTCRRDPLLTLRVRLQITRQAEQFLAEQGQLTSERHQAIARGRIECARTLYHMDRAEAVKTAAEIGRPDAGFGLLGVKRLPWSYRLAYKLFGFLTAERLADMTRVFRKPFLYQVFDHQI